MTRWRDLLTQLESEFQEYEEYLEARTEVLAFIRGIDQNILKASLHVTGPLETREILVETVAQLKEVLKGRADGCYVYLIGNDKLALQAAAPEMPEKYNRLDVDDSAIGIAVRTRQPLLVSNVQKQSPFSNLYKEYLKGATSLVAVPIFDSQRNVLGVLGAEAYAEDAFDKADEEVLLLAAGQLAIVLTHGRWHDIYSWLLNHQERVLEEGMGLSDALEPILEKSLQLMDPLRREVRGQILLIENQELVLRCTSGIEPIGVRVKIEESVSGLAVEGGKIVVSGNVLEEEPFKSRYKSYLGPDILSEVVAPIVVGSEPIGVLNIESPQANAFTSQEVRTLEVFARQAGFAIGLARRRSINEGKRTHDQATALLAMLGSLSGNVVHEINSGVSPISFSLAGIDEEFSSVIAESPGLSEKLDRIRAAVADLEKLPNLLKEYRTSLPEPLDLNGMLEQTVEELRKLAPADIVMHFEANPDVPEIVSSRLVNLAVRNIVVNSYEQLQDVGQVTISTHYFEDVGERRGGIARWVEIHIDDTGPGIPAEHREEIFEQSYSSKGSTGFGLWWARTFVTMLGGYVFCGEPSEALGGAHFVIRLPTDSSAFLPRGFTGVVDAGPTNAKVE